MIVWCFFCGSFTKMYGFLRIFQSTGLVVSTLEGSCKAIQIDSCLFFRLRRCIERLIMVLDGLGKVGWKANPMKARPIAFTNAVEERCSFLMLWRRYFECLLQMAN